MGLFNRKHREHVDTMKRTEGQENSSTSSSSSLSYWMMPKYTLLSEHLLVVDDAPDNIKDIVIYMFSQFDVNTTFKKKGANTRLYYYTFTLNDFKQIDKIKKVELSLSARLQTKVNIQLGYLGDLTVFVYRESPLVVPFTFYTYKLGELAGTLKAYIGQTTDNRPIFINLKTSPHILIAGATGSGKSVCINTILCSLLYTTSPNDLGLILIDPKKVELSKYSGIPHLFCPIATEIKEAEYRLLQVCNLMDERYGIIEGAGKKTIDECPQGYMGMCHVLVVIDEFADLIQSKNKKIEDYVIRIAQKGRAAGIHLLIATQRPTRDVLKPIIKANMTTRIALQTVSQVDSQVILDHKGAEQLNGKGDALVKLNDRVNDERVQIAYISNEEINTIVHWWAVQK